MGALYCHATNNGTNQQLALPASKSRSMSYKLVSQRKNGKLRIFTSATHMLAALSINISSLTMICPTISDLQDDTFGSFLLTSQGSVTLRSGFQAWSGTELPYGFADELVGRPRMINYLQPTAGHMLEESKYKRIDSSTSHASMTKCEVDQEWACIHTSSSPMSKQAVP